MPIYEFFCPANNKIYSFYARSLAYAGVTPRCPDGSNLRLEKLLSRFSVTGRAKDEADPAGADTHDDPRMEQAMAEMEREFSSMDMDNPDPRHVARMMRKMTEVSGERMPEQMEEMMRRLEAGESLDKLEEEFGDAPDALGAEPGDDASQSGDLKKIREKLRSRRAPVRDPILYEMSEYAELPHTAPATRKSAARRRRK